MDTPDAPDVPRPAANELRALTAAARPDWNPDAVMTAMADAHMCGMSWADVVERMGALIADPDAAPRDLTAHIWRSKRRASNGPPDAYRKARAADPILASHTRKEPHELA
ncbi:hypothetical protein [Actinomadura violacea]|uniref:Uncharacterized protein n=1 Tax=Actinomadura violacea TaxID=2819934 RepID=A0ABS3S631_9ACTN|nr:hypothetical protein [Actinomadura violacea]MBO2464473.1 hypothetical protein [Actinomadura violacea]